MSSDQTPTPDDIHALEADWRAAEEQMKLAEHETRQFPVPPANELRYAGRHLLDALTLESVRDRGDAIAKAKRHALRAKYDAAEIRILSLLDAIAQFKKDYSTTEVGPVVKDWQEIIQKAHDAQSRISENRRDDTRKDQRDRDHHVFVECAAQLSGIVSRLDLARDELNKRLREQRRVAMRWALGIGLGVLGLLAKFIC